MRAGDFPVVLRPPPDPLEILLFPRSICRHAALDRFLLRPTETYAGDPDQYRMIDDSPDSPAFLTSGAPLMHEGRSGQAWPRRLRVFAGHGAALSSACEWDCALGTCPSGVLPPRTPFKSQDPLKLHQDILRKTLQKPAYFSSWREGVMLCLDCVGCCKTVWRIAPTTTI